MVEACGRLVARGATAVLICGAAIVGMAARIAHDVPVPVFDGLEAVALALERVQAGDGRRPPQRPVGASTGLSPALAALLAGSVSEPQR